MAKTIRSARGEVVDFSVLAIKQQLSAQPISVGVNQRRRFIDEKDGIKHRSQENYIVSPPTVEKELPSALTVAAEAATQSVKASEIKD